ncbi:hypothetical protein [Peribacillus sp. YIM B13477]|uniref:hypothetical protein n=1 Tax=Peribacillus sp. YIM B13477 TaxID=3366300 RepID=UPI003671B90D
MKPLMFALIILLLAGCSNDDKQSAERLNTYVTTSLNDSGFKDYIKGDITITKDNEEKNESNTRYIYTVGAELNDDFFNNLSMEEQYNFIISLSDQYDGEFDCGDESQCTIGKFTFQYNDDIYEVSPQDNFLKTITINGDSYSLDDVRPKEETETQEATSTEEDTTEEDATEVTPSIDTDAVYAYMKATYEELTNYGETYVPEVHDPQIAELASKKFGITEEEASQIYIDIEMAGGQ